MGLPSNDFPDAFDPAIPQIHVTKLPVFGSDECERVIGMAEAEGHGLLATRSGKYQIGHVRI